MIERFLQGYSKLTEDPEDYTCMHVVMPGDRDPFERHYGFSVYIDAELRLADLGCSVGGGTLFLEPEDECEKPEIAYCILDVDATDIDSARALLRLHLPELGAPKGTMIQWNGREDRFDGETWLFDQPRSLDELDD